MKNYAEKIKLSREDLINTKFIECDPVTVESVNRAVEYVKEMAKIPPPTPYKPFGKPYGSDELKDFGDNVRFHDQQLGKDLILEKLSPRKALGRFVGYVNSIYVARFFKGYARLFRVTSFRQTMSSSDHGDKVNVEIRAVSPATGEYATLQFNPQFDQFYGAEYYPMEHNQHLPHERKVPTGFNYEYEVKDFSSMPKSVRDRVEKDLRAMMQGSTDWNNKEEPRGEPDPVEMGECPLCRSLQMVIRGQTFCMCGGFELLTQKQRRILQQSGGDVMALKIDPLTDDDPMPFGKYKDLKMQDVPADYLDWLRAQSWIDTWPRVQMYLKDNAEAIDAELASDEDP